MLPEHIKSTVLQIAGFAVLYVALFQLHGLVPQYGPYANVASIFFLPAFVRLLAFLVIGFWSIPALFIAAMFCVDLGLGLQDRVIVSGFLGLGAPIGIAIAARIVKLEPSLASLSAGQLLWLSVGSSLGSTLFYHIGLSVVGFEGHGLTSQLLTFIGNTTGTWAIIYLIKALLTFYGRTLRSD